MFDDSCHLLQFEPNEGNVEREKSSALALVSQLEREGWSAGAKKARKEGDGERNRDPSEGVLNVRKAIRYASKGKGATAMLSRGGNKRRGKGLGGSGRKARR